MEGKYIVDAKAYNRKYGVVGIREVFKGTKKAAYEKARTFASEKAEQYKSKNVDFIVTLKGEGWQTATKINPM